MMPRKTPYTTVAIALVALFVLAQELFAVNNAMVLSIRSSKQGPYVVGEPVIVNVALTNSGAYTETLCPQLDAKSQSAMYYVSRDGEKFLYASVEEVTEPASRPIPVAPGESIYHHEMLLYDASTKGLLFPTPGRYYIYIEWYYNSPTESSKVVSNTIEIAVVDPQGKDRGIAEVLKSRDVILQMLFVLHKPESVRKFERIARSNTVYAPYAALRLAEREFSTLDARRRIHKRRAIEWLNVADRDGFPLRARVVSLMAKCEFKLGKPKEAETLLERIKQEYPQSAEGQHASEVLMFLNNSRELKNTSARRLRLELRLLTKPVSQQSGRSSKAEGREEISIALGMPISIRLTLVNEADAGIELLPGLDPSFGLVRLYMVDEKRVTGQITRRRWEIEDNSVRSIILEPREHIGYETFLFGRLVKEWILRGGMKHEYLFDRPGSYELFARYEATNRPHPFLHLTSNRVTVRVGPAIQGWNALKEAQIVALMEGESRTNEEHGRRLGRVRGILENLSENPYAPWLSSIPEPEKRERPVDPELRKEVESVFQAYLAGYRSGDLQQCVRCVAEDFRRGPIVWNRAKQREQFQEDIDKIVKLRRNGVPVALTGRVLSVVRRGEDVVIKAAVSYREGSKPSEDQTVRCRLTKHGNKWLIQQWDRRSH